MTRAMSPPWPSMTSTDRSAEVGYPASIRSSPAVIRRQAASQSGPSWAGSMRSYPRGVSRTTVPAGHAVGSGSDGLSDGQREALDHCGPPLVVTGAPGTGKTEVLIRRLARTARTGSPGGALLLAHGEQAADQLRGRAEAALTGPHEAVEVRSVRSFCGRLLADEALDGGLGPFTEASTPADRLAMLLDRVEELDLRQHEFRGRPAALLASFVRRIDRLKDDLVDAETF